MGLRIKTYRTLILIPHMLTPYRGSGCRTKERHQSMDWRYAFNSTSTAFVNATLGSGSDSGSDAGSRSGSATPIQRFGDWYAGWHGYSALLVCSLGALANAMNCVVLTRRAMVSPANVLLTALAIADAATMVSYLPYATYFYVVSSPDPGELHSYWWALYIILQTNFLITCHTAAMYLTVSLAVFRLVDQCSGVAVFRLVDQCSHVAVFRLVDQCSRVAVFRLVDQCSGVAVFRLVDQCSHVAVFRLVDQCSHVAVFRLVDQ